MTAALGTEPDLVPMVLDLGLVPQRRLDLHRQGETRETHGMFWKLSVPHAETASWEGIPFPQTAVPGPCKAARGVTRTATPTHGGREPATPRAGSHSLLCIKNYILKREEKKNMALYAIKLWGHRPGEHTLFLLSSRWRIRSKAGTEAHATGEAGDRSVQGWGSPALGSRDSAHHPIPTAHILSKKERPLRTLELL